MRQKRGPQMRGSSRDIKGLTVLVLTFSFFFFNLLFLSGYF
jgi:hypothetical protein